jgi:hypothetical protein
VPQETIGGPPAAAIDLIRLDARWTGRSLDRIRTIHLQRLHLVTAA